MAQIHTVRGVISPEELGFTLMHEHLTIRLWEYEGRFDDAGLVEDRWIIDNELSAFTDRGGSGLVELTPASVNRQPELLRSYAEQHDLHIIMGCGWYRQPYFPAEDLIDRRTVDDLASELVHEITHGVGATGIRPGIIGEVGSDKSWITAQEERALRAAGRAANRTNLAISTHAVQSPVGLDQLRIFLEEKVDLSRVIIGHADTYRNLDYHLGILEMGANVQFDTIGVMFVPLVDQLAGRIVELRNRGFLDRIFISQDVCFTEHLRTFGGNGYTYIQDTFLPLLEEAGLSSDDIRQLVEANPRRLLAVD